jgi:hypothetical protein
MGSAARILEADSASVSMRGRRQLVIQVARSFRSATRNRKWSRSTRRHRVGSPLVGASRRSWGKCSSAVGRSTSGAGSGRRSRPSSSLQCQAASPALHRRPRSSTVTSAASINASTARRARGGSLGERSVSTLSRGWLRGRYVSRVKALSRSSASIVSSCSRGEGGDGAISYASSLSATPRTSNWSTFRDRLNGSP